MYFLKEINTQMRKKEDASFQVFDLYMVVPTQPSPILSLKVAFYIWTRNYKV